MKKFPSINQTMMLCLVLALAACATSEEKTTTEESPAAAAAVNPNYEMAPQEYADLAVQSLTHFSNLDFEAWAATLSDDVIFYFPDGDAGTRTELNGKAAVLAWWNANKGPAYIEKMTYENHVEIPILSKGNLPYSNLAGVFVINYFSNEVTMNGTPVKLRMNLAMHFNDSKLIDRVYTYYDRTGIIKAAGKNVLSTEAK